VTKRNELDNKINKLETDLQTLKTEITKARFAVDSQTKYRDFLSQIFKDEFVKLNTLKHEKLVSFKRQWVNSIRSDPTYMQALFECKEEYSPAGDLSWTVILERWPMQIRMNSKSESMTGLPPLANR